MRSNKKELIKDHHQKTNQFILLMELLHLESFSVHHMKLLFLLKELIRLCLHAPLFSVSEVFLEALVMLVKYVGENFSVCNIQYTVC